MSDLISRQAVDDVIYDYSRSCDVNYAQIMEYIDKIPSVENKGEWIADVDKWGDVVTTVNGYTCSKCGTFNSDKDNFCPNCGADMRGET